MTQYRSSPTYDTPLVTGKNTTSQWWRWIQDIHRGNPPSSEIVVTPSGSPFTYSSPVKGNLIVSGGTVSDIKMSRSGTFYETGLTAGLFNMAANDQLKLTYTVAPSLVFLPT